MTADVIPLPLLSAEIAAVTGCPPAGGHRLFGQLATDSKLPSAHQVRGRWFVRREAIPEIIAMLERPRIRANARRIAA